MCKMFKEVTGKENKGNVSELKGLLKAAVDAKMNAVIVRIPVELLEIDESYQIPERTARSLEYLTKNWDDNKLLPLSGVPHWEEGKVYLFDGFGRWIGSQLIKNPKDDLGNGTYKRYKKKSFDWYKHVIETNGACLFEQK